jgi:hypothetical protein
MELYGYCAYVVDGDLIQNRFIQVKCELLSVSTGGTKDKTFGAKICPQISLPMTVLLH